MKPLFLVLSLLLLSLTASAARGNHGTSQVRGTDIAAAGTEIHEGNDLDPQVAAARCAYTPHDPCRPQTPATPEPSQGSGVALAQFPGRMPAPPSRVRPGMGYPPPPYQRWHGEVSGSHVAIGAAIGLALGALIGSRGGAKTAFGFGILGSGIGAAFGAGGPPVPPRRYRAWTNDGGQEAPRGRSRPRRPVPRNYQSEHAMGAVPQAER